MNPQRGRGHERNRGWGIVRGKHFFTSPPSTRYSNPPTCLTATQCFNCSGYGHLAQHCPLLGIDNNIQFAPQTSNYTSTSNTSTQRLPNQSWILDSGATHHITNDLGNLAIHLEYSGPEEASISDGNAISISHIGSSNVSLDDKLFFWQKFFMCLTHVKI